MACPVIEPFDAGLLGVSYENEIYWEVSGNPEGKPALYLHGGPGSGLGVGGYRRCFDSQKNIASWGLISADVVEAAL
jgi:proline iminopeptidase